MDITYIPPLCEGMHSPAGQWMARGFIYLTAALDWFTRRAPSWRVSITLEAGSDIEAVEKVLARHGKPEIFNTDPLFVACRQTPAGQRDSQFTSADFIKVLAAHKIKISMPLGDCRQSPADNRWQGGLVKQRFVERLWREEVYLRACAGVCETRASLRQSCGVYNGRRPRSSLDGKTPDQACFNPQTPETAAA
jgi:putative transposase